MPSTFCNDYPQKAPFRFRDVAFALVLLGLILLGGGTSLVIKFSIFIGLGLYILFKVPRTLPFRGIDVFVISLVLLSWIQFLPKSFFGEAMWASELFEGYGIACSPTVSPQAWVSIEGYLSFLAALAWLYICLDTDIYYSTRVHSLWALGLGGAGLGVIVLLGNYFSWSYPFAKEAAVFSFFPNRNHTSNILCISAGISFCLFVKAFHKKQNRLALLALSATILAFFALVLCLSRASLIFFFLGLVLWLCLQEKKSQGFIQFRYIAPLLGIFVGFWLLSGGENLNRFWHLLNRSSGADFRILIFKDALSCIQQQLFTGLGLGNFQYVFPQFREHSVMYGRILHPENDWLWALAELGLGFTVFLAIGVLYGLYQSLRNQPSDRVSYRSIAFVAVFVFLLHTFIDVPGHRLATVFYAIFLFALSSSYHQKINSLVPKFIFRFVALVLIGGGLLGLGSVFFRWPFFEGTQKRVYPQAILEAVRAKQAKTALSLVEKAKSKLPLYAGWYFQEGQIQLRLNQSHILAKKAFEKARALDPHSIHLPLQEGLVWLPYNVDLAFKAWQIALYLDNYSEESTWRFILNHASDDTYKPYICLLSKTHPQFRAFYLTQLPPSVLEKEIQYDVLKDPKLAYLDEKDRLKVLIHWAKGGNPHSVLGLLEQEPHIVKQAWLVSATAYKRLGFHEASAKLLDKHIQAPQWPILYYAETSKLEELEFRSSFNPKDTILHLALLKLYIEQEKYPKALSTIKRLEKLEYPSPLLEYWKGKIYYVQGEYPESAEAYERFLN